jgi:hypothetical protein
MHQQRFRVVADFPEASAVPRCLPRQSCKQIGPFFTAARFESGVEALDTITIDSRHSLIASSDGVGA